MTHAIFNTNSPPKEVFTFYHDTLVKVGWQIENSEWDEISNSGKLELLYDDNGSKSEDKIFYLSVGRTKEDDKTEFSIRVEFLGGIE